MSWLKKDMINLIQKDIDNERMQKGVGEVSL